MTTIDHAFNAGFEAGRASAVEINFTIFKEKVAALPDTCRADNPKVGDLLEALFVDLFHANFPMRAARAEVWILAHPEPKPARPTPRTKVCDHCHGEGSLTRDPYGNASPCSLCGGTGLHRTPSLDAALDLL